MASRETSTAHDHSTDAVVRRADEIGARSWDDDVQGTVQFRVLFDSADTLTGTLSAGLAEVPPRGWLGMHRHPPPEIYHILEGSGLLTVNGTRHVVEPGSSVFIPGNAAHGIRTVGGSPLRFLYTFPADSLSDVEYEWLGKAAGPEQ